MLTSKRRFKRHRLFNKKCSLFLTLSTLRVCRRGLESPCIEFVLVGEINYVILGRMSILADSTQPYPKVLLETKINIFMQKVRLI